MVKVTILGSAGGIGKPLALLLKSNNDISHLSLYDIINPSSMASDLSYINTKAKISHHHGSESLPEAIINSEIIIILASIPIKLNMTRNDFFNNNAMIIKDLATNIAKYSPEAFILVVSNPLNSLVPVINQILNSYGIYNSKKLLGINSIDSIRASTFISQIRKDINPSNIKIPIIGGHSGSTIIPLFSNLNSNLNFTKSEIKELTNRIKFAGYEVVKAKGGSESATLSMAYAITKFTNSIVNTIANNRTVIESAYISLDSDFKAKLKAQSLIGSNLDYFAFNNAINSKGIDKILIPESISLFERKLVQKASIELQSSIAKSKEFCKVAKPIKTLSYSNNNSILTSQSIFKSFKKIFTFV